MYTHRRFIPESEHGIDEDNLNAFRKLSDERWRRELGQRERGADLRSGPDIENLKNSSMRETDDPLAGQA